MWNAGLDESQAEVKIAKRNINNLRYADDTILMEKKKKREKELNSLLMRPKEKNENDGLKLNIQNIRSWNLAPSLQGKWKSEKQKQWQILFSWPSKSLQTVTVAMKFNDACSLEGKLW